MSNPKTKTQQNHVDGSNNNGGSAVQKKNVFVRIVNAGRKKYLQFKSTKIGRFVIGGTKVLAGGAVLYETFKAGQRSVKPTVIAIEAGEVEEPETDAPMDETEAEEAEDEIVEEA